MAMHLMGRGPARTEAGPGAGPAGRKERLGGVRFPRVRLGRSWKPGWEREKHLGREGESGLGSRGAAGPWEQLGERRVGPGKTVGEGAGNTLGDAPADPDPGSSPVTPLALPPLVLARGPSHLGKVQPPELELVPLLPPPPPLTSSG